jgi:hypothetical protein
MILAGWSPTWSNPKSFNEGCPVAAPRSAAQRWANVSTGKKTVQRPPLLCVAVKRKFCGIAGWFIVEPILEHLDRCDNLLSIHFIVRLVPPS